MIKIKRVYEKFSKSDGKRFLVERLWPRGFKKEDLKMDAWLKEIAPSAELRKWFGHVPNRWEGFRKRYKTELSEKKFLLDVLLKEARSNTVTLLYSARDMEHNGAIVLKEYLEELLKNTRDDLPMRND